MALSDRLISKIDATLARLSVAPKAAYKRTRVYVGGDALIGHGGSSTVTDTALSPPPALFSPGDGSARELFGDDAVGLADLVAIVSSTAISAAEYENKSLTIVLNDGVASEEYEIVKSQPYFLEGRAVAQALLLQIRRR